MPSMNRWEKDFEDRPARAMRNLLWTVFWLTILIGAMGLSYRVIFAVPNAAVGVTSRTLTPDNIIYNYEWFHRQYGDYLAMSTKLWNAEAGLSAFEESVGPRSGWQFEDRQEYSRLSSIVLGLKNQRADLIQTYNARSRMTNRNIFRGREAPTELTQEVTQ